MPPPEKSCITLPRRPRPNTHFCVAGLSIDADSHYAVLIRHNGRNNVIEAAPLDWTSVQYRSENRF